MSAVADRMRSRRLEMGLSLQEAQSALRIHRRHLYALEGGRLLALPGGEAHAAAMLRAYANFLGLDGPALLADLRREEAEAAGAIDAAPARSAATRLPWWADGAGAAGRWPMRRVAIGAAALVVLAAAGGVLALHGRSGERPAATVAPPAATVAPPAPSAAGVGSPSTPGNSPAGSRPSAAAPTAAPQGPAAPPAPKPAAAPRVSVAASTSTAGLVTYVVRGAPDLAVAVSANARCWYRVWLDGSSRHTDGILAAGASTRWTAGGRLQIRLGFPSGVRLSVDGVSLPAIQRPDPVDLVFVRPPAP